MNKLNLIKLKIKAKHLALEPSIIRKEERKVKGMDKWDLQHHRKTVVRNEARATQLAIAFIKERPYKELEISCKDLTKFNWYIVPRIVAMVNKYSNKRVNASDILVWTKN